MSARKPPPSSDLPPQADDPEQSKRFIDMAREVEVDEDPEAFDRAFKRLMTSRGIRKLSSDQKVAKPATDRSA